MLEQIGDGSVEIGGLVLRLCYLHRIVDRDIATKLAHKLDEELLGIVEMRQQHIGHHQGAGIDKGIAWAAMLVLELHQ